MNLDYPVSSQPIPKHAKLVYKGKLFEIWQWQQKMFDSSTETFEKIKRSASVGVLPITKDNKIILTVQEQPGMKQFISLVGGVVDEGEEPNVAAERELLEETGMESKSLDLWFSIQPVGKLEWPIYIFIARGCETIAEQNLDSGEKISLKKYSWNEFLELIQNDEFRDKEISFKLLRAMQKEGEIERIKKLIFR